MGRVARSLLNLVLCLAVVELAEATQARAQISSALLGPTVTLTGQTAAIATTTLYTAGTTLVQGPGTLGSLNLGGGTFRIHTSVILTTAGTAGTINASVVCNNGTLANTQAGSTVTTTATLGTEADNTFLCTVGGTNLLQYSTTFTGVTGTPAYTLRIRTEWLP